MTGPATDERRCWAVRELHIEGLGGKVAHAQFVHDATEVPLKSAVSWHHLWEERPEHLLTLGLPIEKPEPLVPVIKLYLK